MLTKSRNFPSFSSVHQCLIYKIINIYAQVDCLNFYLRIINSGRRIGIYVQTTFLHCMMFPLKCSPKTSALFSKKIHHFVKNGKILITQTCHWSTVNLRSIYEIFIFSYAKHCQLLFVTPLILFCTQFFVQNMCLNKRFVHINRKFNIFTTPYIIYSYSIFSSHVFAVDIQSYNLVFLCVLRVIHNIIVY